jgi:PEP-CTERM motif
MNSILKFVGAAVSLLVASMGSALAVPAVPLPEPGTIALVGLGIAGAAYFSRRKK